MQFIDDKLNYSSLLFQVILAAGCKHPVTTPPDHTGSRFCGFAAKTSAVPSLSLKVLQLSFEKDRLGWRGRNGGHVETKILG